MRIELFHKDIWVHGHGIDRIPAFVFGIQPGGSVMNHAAPFCVYLFLGVFPCAREGGRCWKRTFILHGPSLETVEDWRGKVRRYFA